MHFTHYTWMSAVGTHKTLFCLAFTFTMDFAKRQLEKYGWSEGQGLGKESQGMKTALKPLLKFDKGGIGHDSAEEFKYHWWEDVYNMAADNISVEQTKNGVQVEAVTEDLEISTVKRAKLERDRLQFGRFLKRSVLSAEGENPDVTEEAESSPLKVPEPLSDEQLFQACGGLTAHKAARHGHKLSGKLQRLKEQEEALLKAFQKTSSSVTDETGKGSSINLTKQTLKGGSDNLAVAEMNEVREADCDTGASRKSKKKKRKADFDEQDESLLNFKNSSDDVTVANVSGVQESNCDIEAIRKSKKKKRKAYMAEEDEAACSTGRNGKKEKRRIEKEDAQESPIEKDATENRKEKRKCDPSEMLGTYSETSKRKKKKKKKKKTDDEES